MVFDQAWFQAKRFMYVCMVNTPTWIMWSSGDTWEVPWEPTLMWLWLNVIEGIFTYMHWIHQSAIVSNKTSTSTVHKAWRNQWWRLSCIASKTHVFVRWTWTKWCPRITVCPQLEKAHNVVKPVDILHPLPNYNVNTKMWLGVDAIHYCDNKCVIIAPNSPLGCFLPCDHGSCVIRTCYKDSCCHSWKVTRSRAKRPLSHQHNM